MNIYLTRVYQHSDVDARVLQRFRCYVNNG